jgi:hypothetical protein
MEQKPITRIDLERVGTSSIFVRTWTEGWKNDGSTPASSEELIDGFIPALLSEYEKAGFVVWMASGSQGRALRGKITRVDILFDGTNWKINKYPYGWSAKTPPIESKVASEDMRAGALAWLQINQWTVMECENGHRAFKGTPYPVRDRATIQHLRRKAQEEHRNYTRDFAYW